MILNTLIPISILVGLVVLGFLMVKLVNVLKKIKKYRLDCSR
jgi:hypothetical protein